MWHRTRRGLPKRVLQKAVCSSQVPARSCIRRQVSCLMARHSDGSVRASITPMRTRNRLSSRLHRFCLPPSPTAQPPARCSPASSVMKRPRKSATKGSSQPGSATSGDCSGRSMINVCSPAGGGAGPSGPRAGSAAGGTAGRRSGCDTCSWGKRHQQHPCLARLLRFFPHSGRFSNKRCLLCGPVSVGGGLASGTRLSRRRASAAGRRAGRRSAARTSRAAA